MKNSFRTPAFEVKPYTDYWKPRRKEYRSLTNTKGPFTQRFWRAIISNGPFQRRFFASTTFIKNIRGYSESPSWIHRIVNLIHDSRFCESTYERYLRIRGTHGIGNEEVHRLFEIIIETMWLPYTFTLIFPLLLLVFKPFSFLLPPSSTCA